VEFRVANCECRISAAEPARSVGHPRAMGRCDGMNGHGGNGCRW
jgi:hypothetical protein